MTVNPALGQSGACPSLNDVSHGIETTSVRWAGYLLREGCGGTALPGDAMITCQTFSACCQTFSVDEENSE